MVQQKITLIAELKDKLSGPLQAIEKQADRTAKSLDEHGKRAEKAHDKAGGAAKKSAEDVQRASTKAERALASVGMAAGGMASDVSGAGGKAERALASVASGAQDSAGKLDRALATAGQRGGDGMVSNLKSAGSKFVAEAGSIGDKAGEQIKSGIENALSSIDMPGLAQAGTVAGGAGIIGATIASMNRDSTSRRVAAVNAENPEDVRVLLDSAYGNNYGGNYDDLARNGSAILATFDVEPGSPEAQALLEGTTTINELFELDPNLTAQAIKVFMEVDGLSVQEAGDSLAGVLQDSSAIAREEITDYIHEYGDEFAKSGMSVVEGAAIAAEASQLGGNYGADQAFDMTREWGILLKENNEGAREGYEQLDLDMDHLNELRTTGRADEAFRLTNEALAGADQATRDEVAPMIMGDIAGDFGSENMLNFNRAAADGTKTVEDYVGVMDVMQGKITEGPGAEFSKMMRAASEAVVELGDAIAPILTPLFKLGTALAPAVGGLLAAATVGTGFKMGKGVLGWFGSKDGKDATTNAGKMGGRIGGITGALGGLSRVLFGHPLIMLAGVVWGASEAFKSLYENSDTFRGVVDGIADSWQRANDNMTDYINMADDALSKPLGLENEGGHREYKAMRDADIRPDWFKDFTRPLEEGLGIGPQSKPYEGLFSLPKVEEKHADGGWTSGNAYRSGERGREFVTQAWASNKVESNNPGALAYINATGELPAATQQGDTIMVDARGAAPGVEQAVYAAVEAALARQGRKATREYMTPTAKGAH